MRLGGLQCLRSGHEALCFSCNMSSLHLAEAAGLLKSPLQTIHIAHSPFLSTLGGKQYTMSKLHGPTQAA